MNTKLTTNDWLGYITELIQETMPTYRVSYESRAGQNVAADRNAVTDSVAYIEEFTKGRIQKRTTFLTLKTVQVYLYLYKHTDIENTATDRQALRDEIEADLAPFINRLLTDDPDLSGVDLSYPMPIYDANECGVEVMFTLEWKPCCAQKD